MPFSTEVRIGQPTEVGPHRAELLPAVDQLYAEGGTYLYEAVMATDDAVTAGADGQDINATTRNRAELVRR